MNLWFSCFFYYWENSFFSMLFEIFFCMLKVLVRIIKIYISNIGKIENERRIFKER